NIGDDREGSARQPTPLIERPTAFRTAVRKRLQGSHFPAPFRVSTGSEHVPLSDGRPNSEGPFPSTSPFAAVGTRSPARSADAERAGGNTGEYRTATRRPPRERSPTGCDRLRARPTGCDRSHTRRSNRRSRGAALSHPGGLLPEAGGRPGARPPPSARPLSSPRPYANPASSEDAGVLVETHAPRPRGSHPKPPSHRGPESRPLIRFPARSSAPEKATACG